LTTLSSTIDGLMIDIAGVLTIGGEPIPGAQVALQTLRARGIPLRFITNSTIYCRHTLCDLLQRLGFAIELDELFTATLAASLYLQEQKAESYLPLLMPDAQQEFAGLDVDEQNPQYVVVGDLGAGFTYARMNTAFRALLNGAHLVALHKKRFWRTPDGLFIDAGSFVAALEYASGVGALVVGKPSSAYFRMVLDDLGVPPQRVAMIGDDIEADVRGAQKIGAQGWLVKTGKYRRQDLGRAIWPEQIFENFGQLVEQLCAVGDA